jgi:N-acetylglucosamine-6-sulfatase
MKRIILIASALISSLNLAIGQNSETNRPNVVIVISDDHRHDWMGHKNSLLLTPNLDRLAGQGWSFPNAFVNAGVCSPSRASFLTGKYMHQASAPDIVWDNNSFLRTQTMFPQRLKKLGYKTGYIGKFHLGEEEKPTPGYDLWASFEFVGGFFNQNIWVNGVEQEESGFTDDNVAEMAENTIKEWSEDEQPFCLIVGLKAPHIPFTYPDRMKQYYEDTEFPEPETFYLDYSDTKPGLANNLIQARKWPHAIPAYGSFQEWVRSYTRLATTIDQSVGTVMNAVEDAGLNDNTIFIYTSDHGYSLGEFNMCEKHYAYEQIMRIPMIARFPNQKRSGNPPNDMVMLMDLAPTVMDYCAGKIPGEMEGKSWRVMEESNGEREEPLREELFFDFWHNQREILPPMQAVRTEQYKLIDYEYMPYKELYDLEKDPFEKENLIDHAGYRTVKKDMEKRLAKWKKETDWVKRYKIQLNTIYIAKSIDSKQPGIEEVLQKKNRWTPLKRYNGVFDLSDYLQSEICYIAIPVNNGSDYDPFINLRITNPENKKAVIPYLGYYQGEVIYSNVIWKTLHGITTPSFRGGFDFGYNPPLKAGQNVILIELEMDQDLPAEWDFSMVGGIEKLNFL